MKKARKGFTLIELIIVILIIGVLAVIALPKYFATIKNARRAEAFATMNSIRDVENLIWAGKGSYDAYDSGTSKTLTYTFGTDTTLSVSPNTADFSYVITDTTDGSYVTATAQQSTGDDSVYKVCLGSGRDISQAGSCP